MRMPRLTQVASDHNLIMIDFKSSITNKKNNKGKTGWKLREANWENFSNTLNHFDILDDECSEINNIEQNIQNKIINTENS